MALIVCLAASASSSRFATVVEIVVALALVAAYRLDVINLWTAFATPWLAILFFSGLELSEASRPVSVDTVLVVSIGLYVGLVLFPPIRLIARATHAQAVRRGVFKALLVIFLGFSVLNVLLAGYVPLIAAVVTGDSGYLEFGVKSIYGLYNAYANAFGVAAFYLWARDRDRLYAWSFFAVAAAFLLFVSRQNLISLLVESFVVFNLTVRRTSLPRLALALALILVAFAFIGNLRTGGSIADIAQIRPESQWIPDSILWLYSYSYFNILNLDNVVAAFPSPSFDGSSLAQLVPSFLRPVGSDDTDLLEVVALNVSSYASPLVRDAGVAGVIAVVGLFTLLGRYFASRLGSSSPFVAVTCYSVLYFCSAFSFFVNFWFYLPIIFQLAFFGAFSRCLFKTHARRASDSATTAAPP